MTSTIRAYLDAGSGSMILQVLAGGLAGLAVTFKLWWGRLKNLLRIGRKDEAKPAEQPVVGSD
jgi:hypothetical protein